MSDAARIRLCVCVNVCVCVLLHAGLEVFRCLTLLLVGLIMGAISLTVRDMEVHNSLGVVFLLGAVVASAIRWVIIHHMLQTHHLQPLQLLILTQPAATFCLAPAAVAIDVQRLVGP